MASIGQNLTLQFFVEPTRGAFAKACVAVRAQGRLRQRDRCEQTRLAPRARAQFRFQECDMPAQTADEEAIKFRVRRLQKQRRLANP